MRARNVETNYTEGGRSGVVWRERERERERERAINVYII